MSEMVPPRTRRLVHDRDRGCRYPGCATTSHIECHHLIHWADGGPTDTYNLAALCPYHHDAHHNRDFTITGNADHPNGLTFTTRHGFPIHTGPTFTTPLNPTPKNPTFTTPINPTFTTPPQPDPPQPPNPPSPPGQHQTPTPARPPGQSRTLDPVQPSAAPQGSDRATSPPTTSPPTTSPPPATPIYRGPSGDTISLRWVTFHEPHEMAHP